ncbi:MAG: hypothetical protein A2X12_10350 [Bacteroidetes bacterium GWE2_29_8]|nr:MAG: hypothetical protein A2X12_10350 [Bacteroidetes bacterium GWE2_29_8]OFY14839.1 MAG: hypothetical protein A2X02_06285 [Bacteroidetes bacterium GWF2_29_10]
MKVKDFRITGVIPQRSPIVMVDELTYCDEYSATTKFCIESDNIFCENNFFQEVGIIENIAQTAAAMSGHKLLLNNQPIKLGFIGAIKNLHVYRLPIVFSTIETTVTIENKVMNVQFIKGIVRVGDNIIAECEMKIFLEE